MSCDKLQSAPLTAGDSRVISCAVTDGGVPVDLTGWTVSVDLYDALTSFSPPVTVTDADGGLFTFAIVSADTDQITEATRLECRIQITQGATVHTILRDKYLTVLP